MMIPLTRESFEPFGDVIQAGSSGEFANQGTAKRFNHLFDNSRLLEPNLCVFKSKPVSLPFPVKLLERHASTQMFIPMTDSPASYLVVVCLEDAQGYPDLATLKVFRGSRLQGFNYRKGVWHHPMIALENEITFTCLVWEGSNLDTEEWFLEKHIIIQDDMSITKGIEFTNFPDLASNANGGFVLFATDDFFAVAENMIEVNDPIWDEQRYTDQGKWMDGWETRRKRTMGHDWCILQLGLSGSIKGFDIDTAFFTGNNAPAISVQGAYLETCPLKRRSEVGTRASEAEFIEAEKLESQNWVTILEKTELRPGFPSTRHNILRATSNLKVSHLRVNIYPDGGVARLRVYGQVETKHECGKVIDFACLENGGMALEWSNAHYGNPMKMLQKRESVGMYDGWETARNPNRPSVYCMDANNNLIIPGNEWAVIKLGAECQVQQILVETMYFKGNYPESFQIEGMNGQNSWFPLVDRSKLEGNKKHSYNVSAKVSHIKLTIYPDGGISRIRILGIN